MTSKKRSRLQSVDPALLRGVFGANLRLLCRDYSSISGLCRDLGINRTQFNRYLSGESFPRPDVLHRICVFFDVDARILLEPVARLKTAPTGLLNHPAIAGFLGNGPLNVPVDLFPNGFYRFTRRSFIDEKRFVIGLVYVFREDGHTFLRGFEAKEAMRQQGLKTTPSEREFRGVVMQQEEGIAILIARQDSMTCSFNFLSRVTSFQNNFWEGYVTRTVRESVSDSRAARMVYEHLPGTCGAVLHAARTAGLCTDAEISPFHRRLLRLDQPFR